MINPLELTGKTILVTGASSGIGRETAICLSQLGARIVITARNTERLEATAAGLDGTGHLTREFDLAQTDEIPGWLKAVVRESGPLDGVAHCAGIIAIEPVRIWRATASNELFEINVNTCLALAKAFRQRGANSGEGALVFLSSVSGLVGEAGLSVYSATKGAIIALTRSLSRELLGDGIRVNCVAPGFVETEMLQRMKQLIPAEHLEDTFARHPLGVGTPHDVACAVAYLLAPTGRWITGTTLVVDGGYTS